MAFSPEKLAQELTIHSVGQHYWIAFSGGLDSTALLHAFSRLGTPYKGHVSAVYVNHNLHANSSIWGQHCEQFCRMIAVPFQVVQVNIEGDRHLGIEGAARQARYRVFRELVGDQDRLLTAHHQDDQVETVFLQLLRGAGPNGLAGMPAVKLFGSGLQLRPLLRFSRAELHEYVRRENLSWIDDPSNQSLQYDRNYLRNKILPKLRERWPGLNANVVRAAAWQAESMRLQDDLAAVDYRACNQRPKQQLSVQCLRLLPEYRQRNLLRYWIRQNGFQCPSAKRIESLCEQALQSDSDNHLLFRWMHCEVRKFREDLYVMQPLQAFNSEPIRWQWRKPLRLDALGLELAANELVAQLGSEPSNEELTVRFRSGGEELYIRGRKGRRKLKKVMQELGIPPWQRDRIPLIYSGDELLLLWGLPLQLEVE